MSRYNTRSYLRCLYMLLERRDFVRLGDDGASIHAMNHELLVNIPVILKDVTGVDNVKMVGTEGVVWTSWTFSWTERRSM